MAPTAGGRTRTTLMSGESGRIVTAASTAMICGPVVAGRSLEDAVYNAEELEETAKLYLLLEGRRTRFLDAPQLADLEEHFPS